MLASVIGKKKTCNLEEIKWSLFVDSMTDQGIYSSKEFTNLLEPASEFKLSMVIRYKINTHFYSRNEQLETKIFKNIIYKNPTS